VRRAPLGEARAGGRDPLPQLVVGLLVQVRQALPVVADAAQPLAGGLPLGAAGEALGLLGQGGLLLGGVGARLGLLGLGLLGGLLGALEQAVDPRLEPGQVADRRRRRHGGLQPLGALPDRVRVAGAGAQPLLEQRHLGRQLLVTAHEQRQALLGRSRLPGADGALAVRRRDVDGAVLGDPAPLAHATRFSRDRRRRRSGARRTAQGALCPLARPACRAAPARQTAHVDRGDVVAVLLVYVLPLTGALVFLAVAGLPQLALALLVVEAVVLAAVVWAKRSPDR
jgi:hypothetical protein